MIGLTGGPIGAAIGAVGGAIVGAAAERMMHSDDDAARTDATTINAETDTTLTTSRSTDIGATDRTTTRPTSSSATDTTATTGDTDIVDRGA